MRFRQIIPEIMAFLTSHPRYLPKDIEWSSKSWTHNVFRVYEMIFWRREGIRCEARAGYDNDGTFHRKAFTLEAKILFFEQDVREYIASFKPERNEQGQLVLSPIQIRHLKEVSRVVAACTFAFLGAMHGMPPIVMAAIAFGSFTSFSGSGSTSPNSVSFSTAGSDRFLLTVPYSGAPVTMTGSTYAGASYTLGVADLGSGSDFYISPMYYLASPATGANNSVFTWTGGGTLQQYISYYTGVVNTGISCTLNVSSVAYSSLSLHRSVTPSASGGWVAWFGGGNGSLPSGVYNATGTFRSSIGSNWCMADSNATVSGAYDCGYTNSSGTAGTLTIMGFGIATAAGPTNVKTWDGLTQSTGIKTYLGLALASVKTVIGLN